MTSAAREPFARPSRTVRTPRELAGLLVGTRVALVVLSLFALRFFPINVYNRDHNAPLAIRVPAQAAWREPPILPGQAAPPPSRHVEPPAIAVWARWDALWYARIAELGYAGRFEADRIPSRYGEPAATGFYPLMPLLMRGLSVLAGTPLRAGLLIANLSLLAAAWLLFRLTGRFLGEEAGGIAASLLLVYPPAFFLSAPYSDSLGLALSIASLALALDRKFLAAGLFGFLTALTRPSGVLLAPALALEWWQARRRDPASAPVAGAFASLLPAAGLAAFLAYCGLAFGDPWAPFHRQETWRGGLGWPPGVFRELSSGPLSLLATRRSVVEVIAALAFLILGALAFRYLPASVAAYGLGATLVPLATSLFSFSRIALASFPVFMTAAALLRGRPAVRRGLEAFFALLLGIFAILYFTWNWIG